MTTMFGVGPVPVALTLPRVPLRCAVQVPDQPVAPTSVMGTMTRPPSRASASNDVGADVAAVVLAALGAVGFATPPFSHPMAKIMAPADTIAPTSRDRFRVRLCRSRMWPPSISKNSSSASRHQRESKTHARGAPCRVDVNHRWPQWQQARVRLGTRPEHSWCPSARFGEWLVAPGDNAVVSHVYLRVAN